MLSRQWTVAGGLVGLLALTGCSSFSGGLQGFDLPGGADVGDNPYTVEVEFDDVLDLVPQSLVKVDDVDVGSVTDIDVDPKTWHAVVELEVNRKVELPANATARVRSTSLLGEKFVELSAPADVAPTGRLEDGARIGADRSSRATEVEEVLGALSLLLNGGGVGQLQTITSELNAALAGREPEIRALLSDVDTLVTGLDQHKAEITRALDGMDRLGGRLSGQRDQIATALDDLGPGVQTLADQRTELVGLLEGLDRLSTVAVDVVNRSRDDIVADLQLLRPTLEKLAEAGDNLPNTLDLLTSFPFTGDAVASALRGDYTNLIVKADLNLGNLLSNLVNSGNPPGLPGLPAGLLDALPPFGAVLSQLLGPLLPAAASFPLLGSPPGSDAPPTQLPPLLPALPPASAPSGLGSLLGPLLGGGS